jgi:hypothetical protein
VATVVAKLFFAEKYQILTFFLLHSSNKAVLRRKRLNFDIFSVATVVTNLVFAEKR